MPNKYGKVTFDIDNDLKCSSYKSINVVASSTDITEIAHLQKREMEELFKDATFLENPDDEKIEGFYILNNKLYKFENDMMKLVVPPSIKNNY